MVPHSFFLQLVQKDFDELEDFLRSSSDAEVCQLLDELHPADIADVVEKVAEKDRVRIMGLLSTKLAAEVLSLVEEYHQGQVVDAISDEKLPQIIDEMKSDDATDILDDLSDEKAREILDAIPHAESAHVRQLLTYEHDTAGGLMQTELISVSPSSTIFAAMAHIRAHADKVGDIQNIHVVSDVGVLVGILPLQSLILQDPDKVVSDVMQRQFLAVTADKDQEVVARLFRKYDLHSLSVISSTGVLLGRILVDDVVDVIQEEASEDIYRLAGVDTEEHVHDSSLRSMRLRLPWLAFNLVTAIAAAFVVGFFQNTIHQVVILAAFMPVVAGMGGNAGTQSLTVITRGLAIGDLHFSDAKKVLLKEGISGLLNGILLGSLMALLAYLWVGSPFLGLVLGLAMVCNLFVAALVGTAIPLFLRFINVDPALASGVFVTTFTDITGFFAYLGLATLFLSHLI